MANLAEAYLSSLRQNIIKSFSGEYITITGEDIPEDALVAYAKTEFSPDNEYPGEGRYELGEALLTKFREKHGEELPWENTKDMSIELDEVVDRTEADHLSRISTKDFKTDELVTTYKDSLRASIINEFSSEDITITDADIPEEALDSYVDLEFSDDLEYPGEGRYELGEALLTKFREKHGEELPWENTKDMSIELDEVVHNTAYAHQARVNSSIHAALTTQLDAMEIPTTVDTMLAPQVELQEGRQ